MNKFTVHYPNGIKRHINRLELALLASSLIPIGPREFRANTFHDSQGRAIIVPASESTAYLQGRFVIVAPGGRKSSERLESVGGMTQRLFKQGIVASGA